MGRLRIKLTFKKVLELRKKMKLPKRGLAKTRMSKSQNKLEPVTLDVPPPPPPPSLKPKMSTVESVDSGDKQSGSDSQAQKRKRQLKQIRQESSTVEEAEARIKELRKEWRREYHRKYYLKKRAQDNKFSLSSFPVESCDQPIETVQITSSQNLTAQSPEKLDLEIIEKVSVKRKLDHDDLFSDCLRSEMDGRESLASPDKAIKLDSDNEQEVSQSQPASRSIFDEYYEIEKENSPLFFCSPRVHANPRPTLMSIGNVVSQREP